MKKGILLTLGSIVVVALLSIGGTMAWFTGFASVENVFATGNISVDIEESTDGEDWQSEGLEFENFFLPGSTETKQVRFRNIGSNDGYLRVKVNPVWTSADGETDLAETNLSIDFDEEDWLKIEDGDYCYYYYTEVLSKDEITEELFNNVKFNKATIATEDLFTDANTDNDYQGANLNITIDAQIVQAANAAADEAFGSMFTQAVADEIIEGYPTES